MPTITFYYFPSCPFCNKVLNYMQKNTIDVTLKNTQENSEYRKELLEVGGKTQVPCLVVDGKAIYESEDIIQWFKDNKEQVS